MTTTNEKIITIKKDIETVDKLESKKDIKGGSSFLNKNINIIMIVIYCIIAILVIYTLYYCINSEDDEEGIKEEYKTPQVRSDPYDEYDLDSDIKSLVQKQENYLRKIVN